ncbi:MAG: hypothetical protein F4087_08190 [Gemmatimonadetes bacterium]|nr:hypothetical protein [Gemmatimonadota bacterium]MDE2679639.1 hypothetical protein [Gemmatimonadota bacterium]MXX35405.1 hypothetical protein [Gemmatimonadota bacterium]MYA11539.1 hypothetical protein [Gemmatimonadota bacterium]MYD15355.1 hypothetical protein [Gemmatimonadota bacterium]
MTTISRLPTLAALFALAVPALVQGQRPGAGGPDQAEFLRAVAEHFGTPQQEVAVLAQWRLDMAEIPVVLFVADRAGVSPDVVISQRRRGEGWMAIAHGYSVHAGDFHIPIDGDAGILAGAYERFSARAASEWHEVTLSDVEVAALVNVRFLSRHLGLRPDQVVGELGGSEGMVAVFVRLKGGGP